MCCCCGLLGPSWLYRNAAAVQIWHKRSIHEVLNDLEALHGLKIFALIGDIMFELSWFDQGVVDQCLEVMKMRFLKKMLINC